MASFRRAPRPVTSTLPEALEMPPPRSTAEQLIEKVIRYARNIKNIHEDKMWCSDCKWVPNRPVTGRCGHTRCTMCIKRNGACLCGAPQPESLHRNILVQDLIEKMTPNYAPTSIGGLTSTNMLTSNAARSLIPSSSSGRICKSLRLRIKRRSKLHITDTWSKNISPTFRVVSSPLMRYEYALELITAGRYRDAAAHLAHVAASAMVIARLARERLAQVIEVLCVDRDPRLLTHALYKSVRQQCITSCVDPSSVECPVCYNVMEQPVTTTCGHTFCRCCIKRTMQTRNLCPLCSSSLSDFHLAQTDNTEFVCAILGTIATSPQIDPDFIPIFACTVAFPDIPCPLMIVDTYFRNVVRGVLDSGSRRFGMLAALGDDTCANYGTIVEVKDCVVFEDGKSILSTVGVSRFRVTEKVTINGSPYARIQEHTDIIPVADVTVFGLQLLAQQISTKVQQWLPSLDIALRTDIATYFGPFPEMNLEGDWWDNPHGPVWLWWLIAILPLKTEIQMLMLSTRHLTKRMTAVLRTLDAMEYYTYRIYRII